MSQKPGKKRIVIKIGVSDYVGKKKNSKTVVLLGASVGVSAYLIFENIKTNPNRGNAAE